MPSIATHHFAPRLLLAALCLSMSAGVLQAQSRDSLFDEEPAATPAENSKSPDPSLKPPSLENNQGAGGVRIFGSSEINATRTIGDPEHWSHLRWRNNINAQGGTPGLKWKLGARIDLDGAYASMNHDIYPADVRKDQRVGLELRENYLDTTLGPLELRLGKQNIVWGEMVGMFVADVISARDLRDFYRTDLENVRRTQWAARFEHFSGDWHNEFVWIPVQTYDNVGKPGADFYPYPAAPVPGMAYVINPDQRPERKLSNSSLGLRTGLLKNGWDMTAFAYWSRDVSPVFERQITVSPVPATIYTPVHDRIRQFGGTVSKDLGNLVFRAESVWTGGRRYSLTRLDDNDGLLAANTLDTALGIDFVPFDRARFNVQLTQKNLSRYDDSMPLQRNEWGGSLMLTYEPTGQLEAQILWATSFNRTDGWVNPLLTWKIENNIRLRLGADIFYGPQTGAFGRYNEKDRVFGEIVYNY